MSSCLFVTVDELWLKKGNQADYFKLLKKHFKEFFRKHKMEKVDLDIVDRRIIIQSQENQKFSKSCLLAMAKIPGIHRIYEVQKFMANQDDLFFRVLESLGEMKALSRPGITFKVTCKRSDKIFPVSSMQLARELGAYVLHHFPSFQVELKNPDLVIDIKVIQKTMFLSFHDRHEETGQYAGIGGLPIGSSGSALTLLSGGFDSPVASYLMAKRGVAQTFLFFHAYPFVGDEVVDKISQMTQTLSPYFCHSSLFVIPYGKIQKRISQLCFPEYRTLLFRWYMMKIASHLGEMRNYQAIITGDALSQVASQTLSNLSVIDRATNLPILRPLLGYNKVEIINLAKKIGTHEISLIPHDDACSLLASDLPVLKGGLSYVERIHTEFDKEFTILRDEAIAKMRRLSFNIAGEKES